MQLYFLPTDIIFFVLLALLGCFAIIIYRREPLYLAWMHVWSKPLAVCSFTILLFFISIAFIDSVHFQKSSNTSSIESVLDLALSPAGQNDEKTYSAPFAKHLLSMETLILQDGSEIRAFPPLKYARQQPLSLHDIAHIIINGPLLGCTAIFALAFLCWLVRALIKKQADIKFLLHTKGHRSFWLTLMILFMVSFSLHALLPYYHIMGTDKVGQDIFYETIKSIRTGILIGTLTTLMMLPLAIIFGIVAGYFGGFIDDLIQYLYTTLSSIPGVLLIAASVLSLQLWIENHAETLTSIALRADLHFLSLCIILGVASWTSLCRLLRAETLKLRELDFIAAAKVLGAKSYHILMKHILPNVFHIVLMTLILDFSGLVLAEAVLSYVGVGVDPTMMSWGNMINSARLELARSPVVWWPLAAAFTVMFILVLAANFFGDAVQEAFDPRKL